MAIRVSLPPSLASERSVDAATAKRGVAALRWELDSEQEPARKAALALELARHHERTGDGAAAARDALAATNLAAGFAEPLELLIRIARGHRSRGNLTKLLERLFRVARTTEERERAALELLSHSLENDQTDEATRVLEEWASEDAGAPSLALARALLASHRGDFEQLVVAWREQAAAARSSDYRARLLERVARALLAEGNVEEGLAWLERASEEAPTPARLRRLEHEARVGGRLDWARSAAARLTQHLDEQLSTSTEPGSAEGVASARDEARLRQALHAASSGDLDAARSTLDELSRARPGELLLAALAERAAAPTLLGAQVLAAQALGAQVLEVRRRLLDALPADDPERAVLEGEWALAAAWTGAPEAAEHARRASGAFGDSLLLRWLLQRGHTRAGDAAAAARELSLSAGEAPRATRANLHLTEALAQAPHDPPSAMRALEAARDAGLSSRTTRRLLRVLAWLAGSPQLVLAADLSLLEGAHDDVELGWEALRLAFLLDDSSALGRALAALPAASAARTLAPLWLGTSRAEAMPSEPALDRALARALGWVEIARELASSPDGGLARLESISAAHPEDPLALSALARSLEAQQPERAARVLLRGAESLAHSHPGIARVWAARAALLSLRVGKHAEAVQALEACAPPGETPFGDAEALLLAALGTTSGARGKAYEEAAVRAGVPTAALTLALESLPDVAKARDALARVESTRADDPAAWLRRLLEVASGAPLALDAELGSDETSALAFESARVRGDQPDALRVASEWLDRRSAAHVEAAWITATLAQRAGSNEDVARAWRALGDAVGSARLTAHSLYLSATVTPGAGAGTSADELRLGADSREPSPELTWLALEVTPSAENASERTRLKERLASQLEADDAQDPDVVALRLQVAFELLTRGEDERALESFEALEREAPGDPSVQLGAAWVARRLGRADVELRALTALAERCADDVRAADYWERVAELHVQLGDGSAAESAYSAALARVPGRDSAFERLYRLVRARSDRARLVELLDARLELSSEPSARVELSWEKARACRALGRRASALRALDLLLSLEPDHLAALALSAEIHLSDERFERAAETLRAIATHPETPHEVVERAGLHAVDLLERLHRPREAVILLADLERRGVDRGGILERRARNAARAEDWELSFATFRELSETSSEELALEGARMMLALQRDHLKDPALLLDSARRVLGMAPLDDDAVEALLSAPSAGDDDAELLRPAFEQRLRLMRESPQLGAPMARLAELAARAGASATARVAMGTYSLTGVLDDARRRLLDDAASSPWQPRGKLDADALGRIAGPSASGPVLAVARSFSPLLARLTQPALDSLGLTSLTRVDPFSDHPVRRQLVAWAELLGLADFELHLGGNEPSRILCFEAELPVVVIGDAVAFPLGARDRARLAAGWFACARGVGALAALTTAEAELWLQALSLAVGGAPALESSADVEERALAIGHLLARDTREKLSAELDELRSQGKTLTDVSYGVRASAARLACLIHGDPSILRSLPRLVPEEAERRRRLLDEVIEFSLSDDFESLRRRAGGLT